MTEGQDEAVRIEHIDGHWTVFVHEDGETSQETFETEQFAHNFADGQRIRLGLTEDGSPKGTPATP